jgi:hypothetical protein
LTITLKLKESIQQGTEQISELLVRKPKAKDIRKLPADPKTGDILDLAGRLCGQPPSVIDELCMEDTMELLDIVGNFIQPGQKTGAKD